jgi:PDZ domain
MASARLLLVSLLTFAAAACGGSAPPAKTADAPPSASAAPTAQTTAAVVPRTTQLRRSDVRRAMGRGLGSLLRNVAVEDWPMMVDGRFHGWRIRAINPEWGTPLASGDVVTRINGMPIEHPEEADAALRSLDKAASLKVEYERDGKPLSFELPIVDDGAP